VTPTRERPGFPGDPTGGPGPAQAAGPGAKGALLLAAAVVLGIVLLQAFDTGIGAGGARVSTGTSKPVTTSTTRRGASSVPGAVTTTTVKARAHGEVRVVVANGAGIRGLGGRTTDALKSLGYNTLAATDTSQPLDKTQVQFADGYEAEAREVAQVLSLPLTSVQRLNSPPVAPADLGDAKVVVLLGADVSTSTTSSSSTTSTTRRA
jgi:hypothetical protein